MAYKTNTAVVGFGIGNFVKISDGSSPTTGTPTCGRIIDGVHGACTNAAVYTTSAWEIDLSTGDMNGTNIILTFSLVDYIPITYTLKTETKLVSELNDVASTDIVSGGAIDTTTGSVDNVTLVDTTTTNTDKNTLAATDIVTGGAIATTTGSVDNVTLVDTTTTNTDKNTLAATDIVSAGAITTLSGAVVNVDTVDTVTTVTGGAIESKQDTAQDDLDIITGADGTILNTTQANYAPNVVVPDPAGTAPTVDEIWAKAMSDLAGIPAFNASVLDAINIQFMAIRNKQTGTASAQTIANDAGATIATAVLSDAAGTTTKEEYS